MSVEGLTCSFPNISSSALANGTDHRLSFPANPHSFSRQGDHFVITLLFIVEREGTVGTLVMGSGCIDL